MHNKPQTRTHTDAPHGLALPASWKPVCDAGLLRAPKTTSCNRRRRVLPLGAIRLALGGGSVAPGNSGWIHKPRNSKTKQKKIGQKTPPRQNVRWMQKPDAHLPYGHKKVCHVLVSHGSVRKAMATGVFS